MSTAAVYTLGFFSYAGIEQIWGRWAVESSWRIGLDVRLWVGNMDQFPPWILVLTPIS